jgi:hypothetical protein
MGNKNKSVAERSKYGCVPIPSWFTKYLPTKEPFSKLEAYFSLRVDYQKSNTVSLAGLSKRWGWSREKARQFVDRMGFEIAYPQDTRQFKKQWGYLKKRHNNSNDANGLQARKYIKHKQRHKTPNDTEDLQSKKDIRPDTTISLQDIDKDSAPRHPSKGDGGAAVTNEREQVPMPTFDGVCNKARIDGLCKRYSKQFGGVTEGTKLRFEQLLGRGLSDGQIWNIVNRSS